MRDLVLGSLLGREIFDMRPFGKAERHERWFWHVLVEGILPERWTHTEEDPADGSGPVQLELFWADLREPLPALIAGHDRFVPELRLVLGIE
ncbi:MAG: hypothetical protein J5I28_06585 [Acidimicrobiales bacterium]|nr:hypothetical protein [Acidimicrobiales bacterium]